MDILPKNIIKYILEYTDTITTIKYSMTNKNNYDIYYPKMSNIRELVSAIIKSKNTKYIKMENQCESEVDYSYDVDVCEICNLCSNGGFSYFFCVTCEKNCCEDCMNDDIFEYCDKCYSCETCNKITKKKNKVCIICDTSKCYDCYINQKNYIVCSDEFHYVCEKCTVITFYCKECLQKSCHKCLNIYGGKCKTCKKK